ncbi:MAG: putative Ig domain-containing protein, partial [Candidatus Poseidoniales archaeon]
FIPDSQDGLYYRVDSAGPSYLVSREVSQSDTYMVTSIDVAPDGTVGIAHTNDTTFKTYFSYCSSGCTSASSWSTELVSNNTSSEVVLQFDGDGTPWILLTHNTTGATIYELNDGTWDGQAISAWPGAADSFGMMINSAGYVFTSLHLVNPGELWTVTNPVVAGSGLYVDADGDGWVGMKEIACGKDRMNSSSTPSDWDEDGRCDSMDTSNDLPSIGDSTVLAQGMDFACAILDGGDITCWGDNTYGKLGGSASGVSWPAGFDAVDIDAGEAHACALSADGEIMCWGRNNMGQIGIGSTSASEDPTILSEGGFVDFAAGANHNCAVQQNTQQYVYCWGNGADSQTGQYYVADSSAGYDDDFEAATIASDWTLEGSSGQFGSQWVLDSTNASSGSSSFKSNGHASSSDVGFSITKRFVNGTVSFDYIIDTCPIINNCNDRFSFSIDGVEVNSSKGNMSSWSTYTTNISSGMHTLRWSFIKDGSSANDANGDYVAIDDIQIRTGFRVESGGVIDTPAIMDINTGGLIESIVAGERHTCITNHLSEVMCMGYNGGSSKMVLGNSSTTSDNSSSLVKVDVDFGSSNVRSITTGYDTSCAILDNSTQAVCWGQRNDWSDTSGTTRSGELLLGSSSPSIDGTIVDLGSPGDRIYSISMGESHACAVVENTIECWGVEESGSFGQAVSLTSAYATPVTISSPSGLIARQVVIEHSTDSTCGVFEDSTGTSTVICWGEQTAVGYTASTPVTTLADLPVEDSNGNDLSLSEVSQSPYDITDIQSGERINCVLSRQGLIKCWGYGPHLGIGLASGNIGDSNPVTEEMGEYLGYVELGDNITAKQLSVADNHACALLESGEVSCWGDNSYKQSSSSVLTSTIVTPLIYTQFGSDNLMVATSEDSTCVLKEDDRIQCAGLGYELALGQSAAQAPLYLGFDYSESGKFVDIQGEPHNSGSYCATTVTGAIKCWGQGAYISYTSSISNTPYYDFNGILSDSFGFGELGGCLAVSGTTELHESTNPETYPGDIVCWGSNTYGRLGTGSSGSVGASHDIMTARPIDFNGTVMTTVDMGQYHSCSISSSNEIYCWGQGAYGQLGYETTNIYGASNADLPFLNPVDLDGDAKLLSLAARSTCAVMENDDVYCWGSAAYGQLGQGYPLNNIGISSGQMGYNLSTTDVHMRPTDFDLDGTIDHWDTDDDNDGTLDINDDFRLDSCAIMDSDGDGMPDFIYTTCNTTLVEDLDDDNDNWNDTDEASCLTNSKSSTSVPRDLDLDGTCDQLDNDDDNDGWTDLEEQNCESKVWGYQEIYSNYASSNYYHSQNYGTGISFLPNDYGYDFQLLGIGSQSRDSEILEFNIDLADNRWQRKVSITAFSSLSGFDYETFGQAVFTVDSKSLHSTEYGTSTPVTGLKYTFNSTDQSGHHDMAVSEDAIVYLTSSDSIVSVALDNEASHIEYPDGVSNTSGSYSQAMYKQIAVDSNGDIHLLAHHKDANRIYTWIYDLGTNSWNAGIDSFPGDGASIGPGRSSLKVDSNNQPHVALMKGASTTSQDSSVMYSFYDMNAGNWVNRFNDNTPSGNAGVSMELDSSDNIHIAWVDNSNKTAYYTYLSGSSNQQSTTEAINLASYSYYSHTHVTLEIALDKGNDPWIYWSPYYSSYSNGNQLAYMGNKIDTSIDNTTSPSDYDGDGICDMLEIATLDYGTSSLIFEMEMDISYIPEYPAMMPTSVAISPSLPAGLTLNMTTGEISGRVTSTDFAGANYTISTTSGVEAWSENITIKSTMENPLYTGYERLFSSNLASTTVSKTTFASNGETVTLQGYESSSSIMVDGVAAGGNHDTDDIVLSMRDHSGDYIWAKSIRGNGFSIGDVDVDNNGNIYGLFHATASSNDPVEFNFEGVSIDNNGKTTVILAKWDYYGNLQWAINTESSGTSSTDTAKIGTSSTALSSEMDLDKSTGDVALIAVSKAANDDLKFGGMQVGPFGTCLTTPQPWLAKVNTNGQVQWTAVGKSDPTNCKESTDHQVVLHHDGSVTTAAHVSNNWDYDFGSYSAVGGGGVRDSSWIAHTDSSGNWAWAENVTTKRYSGTFTYAANHYFTMDKFSDDTLFFAYVSSESSCTEIEFAGSTSVESYTSTAYCLHTATMNHTNSNVISLEHLIGYSSNDDSFQSLTIYSEVDSNDIAHVLLDKYIGHDLRSTGFDIDLNVAYDVTSAGQSPGTNKITDFGIDNSGSIYFTGRAGSYFMYRSMSLLEQCKNPSTLCSGVLTHSISIPFTTGQPQMYSSYHNIYRFDGDYDHEVDYNSPSEGVSTNLEMIGYHNLNVGILQLNDSSGNINNAALPCGLTFSTSTGAISGTPTNGCTDTTNETYTITVNYGAAQYVWNRSQSFEVTFGISPALPIVSYNPADTTQSYTRGVAITPIVPSGTTNIANLHHFTTYPPLPAGLQVNSTGHIIGTPTANQSTAIFK